MASNRWISARPRAVVVFMLLVVVAVGACGNSTGETGGGAAAGGEAAAGGANGAPGVTDTEIRFASFGTRSNNPLGTCVADCMDAGVKAYFEWRNQSGGIFGRKLVLAQQLDDQLAQNQQRALEITSANEVFGAFSATQLASGWKDIAQAGIPLYTWVINFAEMNGHEDIYGNTAELCGSCLRRDFVYAGTLAKAKKVASLGYGIAQVSKDCVKGQTDSVAKFGPNVGQSIVYKTDTLDFGLPNGIAPEVTAMKKAGVDFIMTCIDLNGVKTLAQELERQGMGGVPVLHFNSYDTDFVASSGSLFDGDMAIVTFRPFEADPGQSQLGMFNEWMGKTGQKVTELAMVGWIDADLAYEGIKAAGPSFSRESVIAATNKMTAYDAGGLINPIDWSRQHSAWTNEDVASHGYKQECTSLVRMKGGKFELVGDKAKPFSCWDNSKVEWSQPTPTDFQ
jgi:branched-chain amino acid transport system substrate-binding protein